MRPTSAAAWLALSFCTLGCDDSGTDFRLRTPVMTDKASDRAALLWQVQKDGDACIEYWKAGTDEDTQVACAENDLVLRMSINGLRADTAYMYRIQSGKDAGKAEGAKAAARTKNGTYEFRTGTGSEETRHFAVMGDSHGNKEVLRALLGETMQATPNLDFLLQVGDAVDDGSVPDSWQNDFINPARDFLAAVPVHVAMGNHDKGVSPPFLVAAAPGGVVPDVETFVSGNAFFLLANTNPDLTTDTALVREIEQRLSSQEAQNATWRFVAFHQPPFAAGWSPCHGYDGATDVREVLVPLLHQHRVDVVFNGHVHGYERGEWQGVTYITTGGGGGDLDEFCNEWPHIAVTNYVHHMVSVDVTGKRVSMKARALDGSVIDRVELQK